MVVSTTSLPLAQTGTDKTVSSTLSHKILSADVLGGIWTRPEEMDFHEHYYLPLLEQLGGEK